MAAPRNGNSRRVDASRGGVGCAATSSARAKLIAADRKDPGNKYVANNMHLLEESMRQGKQVE